MIILKRDDNIRIWEFFFPVLDKVVEEIIILNCIFMFLGSLYIPKCWVLVVLTKLRPNGAQFYKAVVRCCWLGKPLIKQFQRMNWLFSIKRANWNLRDFCMNWKNNIWKVHTTSFGNMENSRGKGRILPMWNIYIFVHFYIIYCISISIFVCIHIQYIHVLLTFPHPTRSGQFILAVMHSCSVEM